MTTVSAPVPLPVDKPTPVWLGMLYGLAAAIIWGLWPVISRLGVQQSMTAPDLTLIRFLVAGLMLLPLVLRRGHGGLGWGKACFLAMGAGVPYTLLTTSGFAFAPAGHGGLIIPSVMLTTSSICGWLILKDRPNGQRILGLLIVLSGVAVIGLAGSAGIGDFPNIWIGHLLFAAGGVTWATYTLSSRAWKVDPLHATALVSVLSMVVMIPIYWVWRGPAILSLPLDEVLFQGLVQGVGSAVLALICFTRAVAILGAARGALFAALVPGFAALFAFPILGEVPSLYHLCGLGLVAVGMVLALELIRVRARR